MRRNSRELVQARELTVNLVRRELKAQHRGTILGRVWSLANPLLLVGLYYVIFTQIVKAYTVVDQPRPDGQDVPFAVYFFAGLVIWNVFGTSAATATGSIVGSGYLLRKVYFPRAILPLSAVLSAMVTFCFELAVLFVITLLFVGLPSFQLLWVPVILGVVGVLAYGVALFLSAVTVFLRDVAHFIGVLLQLWFWGTPIVYSLAFVGDREGLVRLLEINPMTGIVVSFRNVVVLNRPPNFALLSYDLAVGVVVLAIGAWVFQRWQRLFAEIV
ncbi:MAG TPA: ABC transporter permease [Acidimicrobiales bacterium]|jgi:ABC-2 type transport system permease protein|nr:ABC transporter permease [Acidimicrobiales bacterium]